MTQQHELATFGAGCFWCVEAIFQDLRGVEKVVSGYMGGAKANPSYEAVCTGTTGHAEVIQVTFDPSIISYETLLKVFWLTHDPTTLNRQGGDVGTQYRSAVFSHSDEQKQTAEASRAQTEADKLWPNPIVTEITAATEFYAAENYHQNYFNQNGYQPYCMMVINPKVQKFRKAYAQLLKK